MSHFLVIGAKKSGTTYIHSQLREINGINVPPLKETHFLLPQYQQRRTVLYNEYINGKEMFLENDRHFLVNYFLSQEQVSCEKYLELLATDEEFNGECDPELMLLSPEYIKELASADVKIICVLRHPVDRFFSHIKMIINDEQIDPNMVIRQKFNELKHQINHSLYRQTIKNWTEVFASENILFIDNKKLLNDRRKELLRLVAFISEGKILDIPDNTIIEKNINVGSDWKIDEDLALTLNNTFNEDVAQYEKYLAKC